MFLIPGRYRRIPAALLHRSDFRIHSSCGRGRWTGLSIAYEPTGTVGVLSGISAVQEREQLARE
jgi:hypothetical protein